MEFRKCACCGQETLDASVKYFDYCPVCGWQDDPIQNGDPDYAGGANRISLNEARRAIAEGKSLDPLKAAATQRFKKRMKEEAEADAGIDEEDE